MDLMEEVNKCYEYGDALVMHGVNAGVKAWNWTTGKTKAELSNNLLILANIGDASAFLYMHYLFSVPYILLRLYNSHKFQIHNNTQQNLEIKALESGCKNAFVELRKEKCLKPLGNMCCLSGAVVASSTLYCNDLPSSLGSFGLGLAIMTTGTAHHVMRAEYLPPRKNCIQRGLEKLDGIYERNKAEPAAALT